MGRLVICQNWASSVLTAQANVGNVTHCVLNSPNDTIHEQLELIRRDTQQSYALTVITCHQRMQKYEPGKQVMLIARRSLKNPTRCSGNSVKS